MGDVIHVEFGSPDDPASPDEEYADVMNVVAELEPARALLVLSNVLFAVLLAKNGGNHAALWRDLREFLRRMRKLFLASQKIWPPVR